MAVAVALDPLPAVAQEPPETAAARIERALRLPSHRMLMRAIEGLEPDPFETDGCSGGLSTAWQIVSGLFPGFAEVQGESPPWEICCEVHDLAYHDAGGATSAEESYAARLAADERLRHCVFGTGSARAAEVAAHYGVTEDRVRAAYSTVVDAMFDAVRAGGAPCRSMPWRWGYGYPDCRAVLP